ncbi:MAG: dTDP-glucose 4,6-dehydratase [Bdellovibrionaceae bacterium]|nr:dTDP-glucose 4,6-dehydratase [Pseudobdellovibrionaceae bacterium]
MKILVTGAAGFIGSSFARLALSAGHQLIILDKLTYAGHLENVESLIDEKNCFFKQGDISDRDLVSLLLAHHRVHALANFAAESHVDNSIHSPREFIDTNVIGTYNLLECAKKYWSSLDEKEKKEFRYLQVSTDEVYGTLGDDGKFHEELPYQPNSPYSASKAAADHLVRAWHHTYGLPTITTNCSNNYGPRQYPEKLIPVMITKALQGKPLPVYGNGANVRDWIHVEDHAAGVLLALTRGIPGETYCFGGDSERKNIDVVKAVCSALDELQPKQDGSSYSQLISFVQDRAGHDWRYAMDDRKAQKHLGFERRYKNFEDGLRSTIQWYLGNTNWCEAVLKKNQKVST